MLLFIEKIENHRLGLYTSDGDVAESLGWTITLNEDEVEKSDIDGCLYEKGFAPMKSDEEKAREERERIAKLSLTRGDVFRGLRKAKGINKNDIAKFIEAMPEDTPEEMETKDLARIDFEDSLDFFRGVPIVGILGASLGISSEQLDNFFIKGNSEDEDVKANAWKELLTPEPKLEGVVDENRKDTTNTIISNELPKKAI